VNAVGARPVRAWRRSRVRVVAFLAVLGPGLITASADNDAQGITTYSLAGARYGYSLLWLLLFVVVSLAVTQEIGARLGIVTGKGLASLIRERFGVRLAAAAMVLMLIANLGTTAAEFAGIAAALEIFGVSRFISVPLAAAAVFLLISRGSYRRVERVFLVLSALYISYIISAFLAHPDWSEAFHGLTSPHVEPTLPFMVMAVAIVGTTVTPWGQFFLQAYVVDKDLGLENIGYERADVFAGALVQGVVAASIIVATAATIFVTGLTIVDAKDAALALEPLAGRFAETLFAFGLLNAGFLAAGILPLSTSYAVCEAGGFEMGIDRSAREAPVFYGVFAFSILFGAVLVLLPGVPLVPVLFLSATINGVLLTPILVYVYVLANDRPLMGEHRNGKLSNVLAMFTIVMLALMSVALLATLFIH